MFWALASLLLVAIPSTAEEKVTWLPDGPLAEEEDPAFQRAFEGVDPPWLALRESGGIVYLVLADDRSIERYDLRTESWLPAIGLADEPTAFAVDADGMYVSFGRRTSHFTLDGATEKQPIRCINHACKGPRRKTS